MRVEINQTISNVMNIERQILKSSTTESYVLYPDAGKVLKNIITNKIYSNFVCLTRREKPSDFVEIDKI